MGSATRICSLTALLLVGCSQSSPAPYPAPPTAEPAPKTVTLYLSGMNERLQIL